MATNYEQLALSRIERYTVQLKAAGIDIDPLVMELPLIDREGAVKEIFDKAKADGKITKADKTAQTNSKPANPPPPATPVQPPPPPPTAATPKPITEPTTVYPNSVPQSLEERMAALQHELDMARQTNRDMNQRIDAIMSNAMANNVATNKSASTSDVLQDPTVIAAIRSINEGRTTADGAFREGYIKPEDRIEPVMFFANKSNIQIRYRWESGMRIALPEGVKGPITFKVQSRVVDPQTQKLSVRYNLVVENRRLVEFLRKCDKFGIDFFENEAEANRADFMAEWSRTYTNYKTSLGRLPENNVIVQAKLLGIPTPAAWDGNAYVEAVARFLADQEFAARNQAAFENMRRIQADQLLEEKGTPVMAQPVTN